MKSPSGQLAFWDGLETPEPTAKAPGWKAFVTKNHRVLRRWPAAVPGAAGPGRCPQHNEPIGTVTEMCLSCHHEAWAELGRMYLAAERRRSS